MRVRVRVCVCVRACVCVCVCVCDIEKLNLILVFVQTHFPILQLRVIFSLRLCFKELQSIYAYIGYAYKKECILYSTVLYMSFLCQKDSPFSFLFLVQEI